MNWNEYALELATVASKKSKDPWKQVGACLLRHDNTVAGIGYNGFPAGMREDWVDRDKRRLYIPKYVDAISALNDAERHCEALRHW